MIHLNQVLWYLTVHLWSAFVFFFSINSPPVMLSSDLCVPWVGVGWMEGGMAAWINCAVLLLQFTHSSRPNWANSLCQHRGLLKPLPSSPVSSLLPSHFNVAKNPRWICLLFILVTSLCRCSFCQEWSLIIQGSLVSNLGQSKQSKQMRQSRCRGPHQ